jgi:glutamate-1-semialdehyde 2,1-aminomutase
MTANSYFNSINQNAGPLLWDRAKKVIPGGNHLLSKRPEMFLPSGWPAYFSTAKGCKVTALDGQTYIDMSIMGIGTNTLGYGHELVDKAVINCVSQGNMSTLNPPEEVFLAEKLLSLHPWADMARFARTGGEANAIAIRIARAATGKDKILFCGYHGWHDWYLSANLGNNQSLDGHLLPGLEPAGVPRALSGTSLPFSFNNFQQLETLISQHGDSIAAIKMEVMRNDYPKDDFLQKVRDIASDNNILLIFDECTSGFRATFGGLHKYFNVTPDLAMFGKALGNGYAITAVIGTNSCMQSAQATFISSTFWTERIGFVAGLATLSAMESTCSWELISEIGATIKSRISALASSLDLDVSIFGLDALLKFRFNSKYNLHYKTLITQEMLKKGFLAANSIYVCTEHSPSIVDSYITAISPIFELIKECEMGRDVNSLLESDCCHSDFKRLN